MSIHSIFVYSYITYKNCVTKVKCLLTVGYVQLAPRECKLVHINVQVQYECNKSTTNTLVSEAYMHPSVHSRVMQA